MMKPKTLAHLIDHAARIAPHSGIVDTDGHLLAWPEILQQVEALAARLAGAGVTPGDRVGVHHPRSAASFVAVHSIVRVGAVVVPLDPFGPPAGVAAVLEAVEPTVLIGAASTLARHDVATLAQSPIVVVCNGDTGPLVEAGFPPSRLIDFADATSASSDRSALAGPGPDDPAYIIFTSGSTGVPKGIMHTHASGLAYAEMAVEAHRMDARDRLAAIAPLHFDQSTLDLFAAPYAGSTVVMTTEAELRFPASLSKRLETHRASMVYTTPYQLRQLVDRGDVGNRDLSCIRQLAFGGEAFATHTLIELGTTFPEAELFNVYGPAEVNGVTVHSFGRSPSELDSIPIGRPCRGVEILLVDDSGQQVDGGESGEILVHSPTTMAGYWRRPDLNAACFEQRGESTFYRTGDIAHIDGQGRLQFEGRRDNRIKVRGVRIDLEAIERVLESAPGVAHAVAARIDNAAGQRIEAWVVATNDGFDEASVIGRCRTLLPANAVPVTVHALAKVPMTATGKVDRASLRDSVASGEAELEDRR